MFFARQARDAQKSDSQTQMAASHEESSTSSADITGNGSMLKADVIYSIEVL